jgi:signal peptidase I
MNLWPSDGQQARAATGTEAVDREPPAPADRLTGAPLGRPIRRRIGRRLLALSVLAAGCLWLGFHRDLKYYRITSGSMEPTLQVGERIAVDPSADRPAVGDIVVFHPPAGARRVDPVCGAISEGSGYAQPCDLPTPQPTSAIFTKRVVAGPGDTIAIVHGHAVRNGVMLIEPYAAGCADAQTCSFPSAVKVPAGDYYVLGDNRGVSDDSRFWGPVPASWIVGTAVRCSLLGTICRAAR